MVDSPELQEDVKQTFTVVEFQNEQITSVAVINSCWLTPRKTETFWPPTKDPKKFQNVLKISDPNFSNWSIYKVRCLYETGV